MIIVKGVNVYPRQIETVLLRHRELGPEYQIRVDGDPGGDRVTVTVESERAGDDGVQARVRREIHDLLALSVDVRLCAPGAIERSPGKAVRVIDARRTR